MLAERNTTSFHLKFVFLIILSAVSLYLFIALLSYIFHEIYLYIFKTMSKLRRKKSISRKQLQDILPPKKAIISFLLFSRNALPNRNTRYRFFMTNKSGKNLVWKKSSRKTIRNYHIYSISHIPLDYRFKLEILDTRPLKKSPYAFFYATFPIRV